MKDDRIICICPLFYSAEKCFKMDKNLSSSKGQEWQIFRKKKWTTGTFQLHQLTELAIVLNMWRFDVIKSSFYRISIIRRPSQRTILGINFPWSLSEKNGARGTSKSIVILVIFLNFADSWFFWAFPWGSRQVSIIRPKQTHTHTHIHKKTNITNLSKKKILDGNQKVGSLWKGSKEGKCSICVWLFLSASRFYFSYKVYLTIQSSPVLRLHRMFSKFPQKKWNSKLECM